MKSVEFGAKVNNILVDGISLIEKLSFNAFNEVPRLMHCLKMHKRLFGVEAKKVGGDTGYAGTENRDYCKANGIQTSFVKRGRAFGEKKKEKDLVRKELARGGRLPDTETCSQCGALMGKLYRRHEKRTKNLAVPIRNRKIEILMSGMQKLKGLFAASLRLIILNDNPLLKITLHKRRLLWKRKRLHSLLPFLALLIHS